MTQFDDFCHIQRFAQKKERKFWGAINPLRTSITMTGRLKWTTQHHTAAS